MHYRREIDGLRALAVLPVILFHAGFGAFSGGFVGVDVFFVISGYLITSVILIEKIRGTFSLSNFWERRARRILPVLFLMMMCCVPFAWFWLTPQDMKKFSHSMVAVSFYASNFLFWKTSGYFATDVELQPLLHTWSLAVEEQYYLVFPLVLMLLWPLGKRWLLAGLIVVAVISLATAEWGVRHAPEFSFYLLPARCYELLVGAFIAFLGPNDQEGGKQVYFKEVGGIVGVCLVAYSVFTFNATTPFPGLHSLLPTMGTAMIIFCAGQQTVIGRILGTKILVGIGLVSYSAYIWHQPLFAFARYRLLAEPSQSVLAMLMVFAFAIAYLSWKYVEQPFRNKKNFNRKKIFIYSAVASGGFIGFGLIGRFSEGWFGRHYDDGFLAIQKSSIVETSRPACWDTLAAEKSLEHACFLGKPDKNPSFAIVGDSQAGGLDQWLDALAKERGIAGRDFSYPLCSPLAGGGAAVHTPFVDVCRALRTDFFNRLRQRTLPKTLVLLSRWTLRVERGAFDNREGGVETMPYADWFAPNYQAEGYLNALRDSYTLSIKAMLAGGYKVILVYPIPEMGWNVPSRLSRIYLNNGGLTPADASISYKIFEQRNAATYKILDAIGQYPSLVRVRPASLLCNTYVSGRCTAQIKGQPAYNDSIHLSSVGVQPIADAVMQEIGS